jgi:cbb3-type cytochrome oxidase maturation protein
LSGAAHPPQNTFGPVKKKVMSALVIMIVASMFVAGGFLWLFIFSVKRGQYDDDYTPSVRMLFDDGVTKEKQS